MIVPVVVPIVLSMGEMFSVVPIVTAMPVPIVAVPIVAIEVTGVRKVPECDSEFSEPP